MDAQQVQDFWVVFGETRRRAEAFLDLRAPSPAEEASAEVMETLARAAFRLALAALGCQAVVFRDIGPQEGQQEEERR